MGEVGEERAGGGMAPILYFELFTSPEFNITMVMVLTNMNYYSQIKQLAFQFNC